MIGFQDEEEVMAKKVPGSRLNRIDTRWSLVQKAMQGQAPDKRSAQEEMLGCYGKAIHRYLLGAVRDQHTADELFQEFAQRLVEGKFRGADPARGRFRDYIKGALSNLVADYWRTRGKQAAAQRALAAEASDTDEGKAAPADEFALCCRDEHLAQVWAALKSEEKGSGQPLHTALRLRVDQPDLRSPELAELLAQRLGKPVTAVSARQTLHRARERFADLLLDEVTRSLGRPTPAELEQELIELQLLTYCQQALERRAGQR
jgi:RNA polymerase sigma-70 factor (ECF subfamily)